ncbi:MAG: hypothetical protein JXR91_06285 [Deltaproteobacteria bacterium]|nr:hypothetical protein [Deltaproteobacteria bacterium]
MNSNTESTKPKIHTRSVKNFLIEPAFQLKWVARVAIVTTLITSTMSFFIYKTLKETIDLVTVQTLGVTNLTKQAQQLIINQGNHDKTTTLIFLVSTIVILVILLSSLTIVVTHKVAGPVFKIKKLLGTINDTHLQLYEHLRKGDELHDIYEEFNRMLVRLREGRDSDIKLIDELLNELENHSIPKEKIKPLEQMLERYFNSVKLDK